MVAACCLQHVGDEFSSDGCAGFIFLVLSGVWKTRYDCGYSASRGGATGIYHDEEFHEMVVDAVGAGLNYEHVFIAHGFACSQFQFKRAVPIVIAVSQFDVLRTKTFPSARPSLPC